MREHFQKGHIAPFIVGCSTWSMIRFLGSSYEQLQRAIVAVEQGPLPDEALEKIRAVNRS